MTLRRVMLCFERRCPILARRRRLRTSPAKSRLLLGAKEPMELGLVEHRLVVPSCVKNHKLQVNACRCQVRRQSIQQIPEHPLSACVLKHLRLEFFKN